MISRVMIGISLLATSVCHAAQTPIYSSYVKYRPVEAKHGMVATSDSLATQVGVSILKNGGNAIDAAVGVGFALAVTLPRAGNLGGGGFMMVYLKDKDKVVAIDYRETAPLAATETMFLDQKGNPDKDKSRNSILSTGVPGTVAGLVTAHKLYGRLPLHAVMAPAIDLASRGFTVNKGLELNLKQGQKRLKKDPASRRAFFKSNGTPYQSGDTLKRPHLAWSLKQISKHGQAAFYTGKIADKIVAFMQKTGGLITAEDLATYTPKIREPIWGTFLDTKIASMPPPSSGGIHLIQMLNILESFNLQKMGHNTARYISTLAEAMKHAYADRSKYLGDPDFTKVPRDELISKAYGEKISKTITPEKPTPSDTIQPGLKTAKNESNETTHFSVVDRWGNAVSNTYTLNFSFGNKIMVPETGILLNNEMDDFSAKPGTANAYGLIGSNANRIQPGKRMLSSMTPTFVFRDDNLLLVTGSPGGSRIITTVLQIIVNTIVFDMNIAEATNAPRIHHQWKPDHIRIEKGLNLDTQRLLQKMTYTLQTSRMMGSTQSIWVEDKTLYGASDPRKLNGLTEGY